jgi:hypothetical protein
MKLFAGFALAAATVLLVTSTPALAQLDDLCRRAAARYDRLLFLKRSVTPERVSAVYVETFTTKGADREAQAVWRRMKAEGVSAEQATDAHIKRYHEKRSADERAALKAKIAEQVQAMALIRDLVLAFESAKITTDFAAEASGQAWRKQKWDAPHPIEHYVEMIKSKAAAYVRAGLGQEQAAIRASEETQAAVDRDRGVPRSAIIDKGHACYKDALIKREIWLRHVALRRAMGPVPESEAAHLPKNRRNDYKNLSRLTYYTHMKFGSRDYSLDRLAAWEIAAQSSAPSR